MILHAVILSTKHGSDNRLSLVPEETGEQAKKIAREQFFKENPTEREEDWETHIYLISESLTFCNCHFTQS